MCVARVPVRRRQPACCEREAAARRRAQRRSLRPRHGRPRRRERRPENLTADEWETVKGLKMRQYVELSRRLASMRRTREYVEERRRETQLGSEFVVRGWHLAPLNGDGDDVGWHKPSRKEEALQRELTELGEYLRHVADE